MQRNDAYEKLVGVVNDVMGISADSLSEQSTFAAIGADSLDQLQLLMGIEDAFDIEFSDDETGAINSLGDALDIIVAKA